MSKKVVFITGATSGIGKACANYLASKGIRVYGTGRSLPKEDGSAMENLILLPMDITKEESIKEAIDYVLEKEGRIDVLFNNAGMGISGSIEDTTIEEAKYIFETNFFGIMRVCNIVLPVMRSQKSGLIINSSSIGGVIGLPFQGFYSASKFAVEGFSEALSKEVKPFGLKVCILEPGDFRTSFTSSRKLVKQANEASPYHSQFVKAMEVIEKDENGGCDPEAIAKLIYKIISSKRPALRYEVGYISQKFALFVKKILPDRLFENIIINHYTAK